MEKYSANFPSYFYKKEGPLAVPLDPKHANYEDRIVTDEIKRKMDNMVTDAKNRDVYVGTHYFEPEIQKKVNEEWKQKGSGVAPTGDWFSNQHNKIVNVPRTPTLLNQIIMAEEMEHQFNRNPYLDSINNRLDVLTDSYEEEKRAKSAALKRVGGHLNPKTKKASRLAMDSYLDDLNLRLKDEYIDIQEGDKIRKRGPLANNPISDFILTHFWDSSRKPEQIAASKYWESQKNTPLETIEQMYPEYSKPRRSK